MSEVTVPNEANEVEYQITTSDDGPFTVPFSFFEQQDIRVIKRDDATDVETELFLSTDWTFTTLDEPVDQEGVGWNGATITLNSALTDHTLRIFRNTVIERLTNYPSTGPFSIYLLNNELARMIAIMQELEAQKDSYISLNDGSFDTTPFQASGRAICGLSESDGETCAATNRQVDASGPNWLADDDAESAIGSYDVWNTVFQQSGIEIQGKVVDTVRTFDLMTQLFGFIQNRNGSDAQFYVRYRYQVDCYSAVAKIANIAYPVIVPANSAIPFHFMDIAQDIDYSNGDCTVMVAVDIRPMGTASDDLYIQWGNLSVNTSEPR